MMVFVMLMMLVVWIRRHVIMTLPLLGMMVVVFFLRAPYQSMTFNIHLIKDNIAMNLHMISSAGTT